jgi:hypothetical protein
MNCKINNCLEKANYNYKTNHNPAYCYRHSTKDMIKIENNYTVDDILEIIFYGLEKLFK